MTDQRTLKRIITEQRSTINSVSKLLHEFDNYYKNMEGGCYPDWLTRLHSALNSGNETKC